MTALNLDTYSLSLITAREDIISARSSTDWAVFTYEKKWSLKLLDSGVGGLDELTRRFSKNLVQYGLCRVHDPNTGVQRVVLIHWVGDNVDMSRREVTAQHLPSIRRFFKEANVLLGAQKVEDVTQEQVAQALSRVPPPARAFQRPRIAGSREVVGTNYMKTNPAAEMKISRREAFWQRSEREEERRKEMERMRLQEERLNLERDRIQRERLEEEERDRRIQEKEKLVEEQRKEQARMEAERRRLEKERWAQQQKEYEEELKGRFRRSQSIEMAAEAAALVSGRSLHPRDFFRQHDRSVSTSFSPPSTPSSPSKASSGFFHRTTPRYQRSVTESILTPTSRSPTFFQGFQKRDSFQAISPSIPQPCSPAFIFSKSPLPGPSPKVDSLPSFIPPPITASRVTPTQIIGGPPPPHSSHTSPRPSSSDAPFRAEYVTISPAGHSADTLVTNVQERPHHEERHSGEAPARLGSLYRAELVPVDSPATSRPEQQEVPNKAAKSPTSFTGERLTAIKATVSVSSPVTEIAFTYPSPIPEARISASPLNTQTTVSIPPSVLQDIPSITPSAAEVKTPSLTGQVLSSALISQDRTLNVNSLTNETALSTDSYEPKMSIGSTSLVSLLAPIPYTPYSSTRASVLPISARPLIDSVHGYQPHVPHVTEALPVFTSILSERLPKPQPGPTQTEAPLVVPVPLLDSLPVCNSSTPQPTYDHIDLPESLTQSMVLPVTVSSDYQPNPNIPLPYSSSTLPSRNSPQSEASLDNPLPWSSTASSLPSRSSPQSEPGHEILLPWSSSISSSLTSRSSPQTELSNNITLPCSSSTSSSLPNSSSQSELSTDIPLPLSSLTSSSLPSRSSPQSELSTNITLQCSSSTSSSLPSMSLPQSIPTTDIPLPCSSTSSSRNSTQSELNTDIPLQWSSSTSFSLPSKGLPQSESSNNQTKVLSPDESQPNNIISGDLLPESLSVSLPIAFQPLSELQPCHIQVDSPTIGSPTEFLLLGESQLYNQNSDPQLLEYPPEFLSCDIGISAESDPNNIQTDILITQSSSSTIPINISAEFQSKPLLISTGFQVTNIQDSIPLVEPLSSSFINERSTDAQSNNIVADNPLIKPTLGSSGPQPGPQDLRSIQDDILLIEPLFGSSSSHPESSSEPPLFSIQDESLLEPQSFSNEGYSGPDLSILEPPPVSSAFPSENLTEPQLSNSQVESLAEPSTITTSTDSTGPNVQADIPLIETLPESLPLTPEGLTKPPLINFQAEPSCKPPSTTTAVCSAPQLNNQAYMPLIEPLSVSSSILPGSLAEPQSNNIQSQSLAELPFITNGAYPELQLNKDEADIPLVEPLPVSSVLPIERSSGPQSNNIEADSLPDPPLRSTADSPGPQLNNVQTESLPESPPVTNEGSAGCQLNIVRADTALVEVSLGSPSSPTKSSTEPQIYGMPESSTCTSTKSPRDPHLNTIQADIQLLESSPVLLFASEPIALSPESSLLSIQSTSSSESHPSDVLADNPLTGSSPLPTEHYYESQPNRGSTDIQQAEVLPRSSPQPTEDYSKFQRNDMQTDIQLAEILLRSSILPTEHYSESRPNREQIVIQQEEVLPKSSPLPFEDYSNSQSIDIQNDIQQAELLPISASLPTEGSFETQLNIIQTDIQIEERLPLSYSLHPEGSSELQTIMQTDRQQAEVLHIPLSIPSAGSTESQPNDIQSDIHLADLLPKFSSLPNEDSSIPQSNNIQSDIQQTEVILLASYIPTESSADLNDIQPDNVLGHTLPLSTESSAECHIIQVDIPVLEGSSPSSLLTTDHSSDSHASSNRKDVQSPEFMAAAPSTKNSPESQENDSLVHDSSSVPTDGFLDLQLNNVEADIPPQKPPPAPPTEAQPDYVQTGLSVTEFLFVEESSPITTDGSPEPLPHKVQEDSPFIETSLLSSPPSTGNIPDAQLFNTNEICTPLLCIPSDESLPDILKSEGALSESPTVTTCPFNNTSGSVSKPNDGQSLPITLIEEVLHNQFLPPCLPSESSPTSPIRSSSPLSEIVYAEKVVLVEDPHPGSPPVNGNLIALESVPTISPGELEVKPLSHVINIEEVTAIHDVLSSNNITVDEDPPSESKLLHKPLTSNSSEALL
ncbi:uncharacterized protein LOC143793463 [Ranitomeya variabilis]|uniref:uncharacterized protein LOC143793463 n=1 Tax=Ranitomeya variabilis TaxID=490064 RepID=UPI0040576A3B